MARPYRLFKMELQSLDAHIHEDDWAAKERSIDPLDRGSWLLANGRRQLLLAFFSFIITALTIQLLNFMYQGINSPLSFITGVILETEDFYYSTINGGASALCASASAIFIVYVTFSILIKNTALFYLTKKEHSSATGSFRHEEMNYNIYVISIGILSALIFSYISNNHDHSQVSSWWQVAIAGAISGIYINRALERLSDAINVARSGTIERRHDDHVDPNSRRYVRRE